MELPLQQDYFEQINQMKVKHAQQTGVFKQCFWCFWSVDNCDELIQHFWYKFFHFSSYKQINSDHLLVLVESIKNINAGCLKTSLKVTSKNLYSTHLKICGTC